MLLKSDPKVAQQNPALSDVAGPKADIKSTLESVVNNAAALTINPSKLNTLLSSIVPEKTKVVIIGENHGAQATREIIARNLKSLNISDLALEISPSQKPLIDDYLAGKSSFQQLKEELDFPKVGSQNSDDRFLDMLATAKELHIKVHAIDVGNDPSSSIYHTKTELLEKIRSGTASKAEVLQNAKLGVYSRSRLMGEELQKIASTAEGRVLMPVGIAHLSIPDSVTLDYKHSYTPVTLSLLGHGLEKSLSVPYCAIAIVGNADGHSSLQLPYICKEVGKTPTLLVNKKGGKITGCLDAIIALPQAPCSLDSLWNDNK